MVEEPRRGRPRSEQTRRSILEAALTELLEGDYATLTIEGIAARAGAGKQTIYRWWPSKADVVLDALLDLASSRVTVPDRGSLEADLSAFLADTFDQAGQRTVLVGLMAHAVLDQAFATAFRDRFLFSRRAALRTVLDQAAGRAEIAPEVDRELLIDVVYGVLWYRLLLEHAPLDHSASAELTQLVLRAARP